MRIDLETTGAVLGAQTVVGTLTNNWLAGACAMLGLFVGIVLAKSPARIRQFILPLLMSLVWAYIGPTLLC